ncbi:hypothetical protein [Schumannella luteola]
MRFAPALLALTMLVPLAACTPAAPDPEPSPPGRAWGQPTLTFETEEEALAAAMEVYARYVEVGESITAEGGAEPERIKPLVSGALYSQKLDAYETYETQGLHTTGNSVLLDSRLQMWDGYELVLYACHDFSGVRVVDDDGADATPEDRPDIATFAVTIEVSTRQSRISNSELWSHGVSCF